jgi:hypothetical protein
VKACQKCDQQNPDEALFCGQCGEPFSDPSSASASDPAQEQAVTPVMDEAHQWLAFIGPNADRYLEQFKKFTGGSITAGATGPRFALTWHWPAFLFDPFLWFLYRKMYLYALVYAVGPVLSAYFTGDFTVGIVWRVMAGFSANYIYYWHVRQQLAGIRTQAGLDHETRERLLKDLGGIQPYVVWVGVALHLLLLALLLAAIREEPPDGGKLQPDRVAPAPKRTVL